MKPCKGNRHHAGAPEGAAGTGRRRPRGSRRGPPQADRRRRPRTDPGSRRFGLGRQVAGTEGRGSRADRPARKRRAEMADLLAALTRLDRHPPPALAVRPDDALSSIRSALLLGAVVPELQAEAEDLRNRLEQLAALRRDILEERETLETAQVSLREERTELQALLDRKLALQQKFAETGGKRAASCRRRSPNRRQPHEPEPRRARAGARGRSRSAEPEPEPVPREPELLPRPGMTGRNSALLRPPATPPSMPSSRLFSDARGLIRPPVAGTVIRDFGSREASGTPTQGITISTPARCTNCCPIRRQNLLCGAISALRPTLDNLRRRGLPCVIGGHEQDRLCRGPKHPWLSEPVGTMGSASARNDLAANENSARRNGTSESGPALYIEFRKDGEPIDPRPWLLMSDKKARG